MKIDIDGKLYNIENLNIHSYRCKLDCGVDFEFDFSDFDNISAESIFGFGNKKETVKIIDEEIVCEIYGCILQSVNEKVSCTADWVETKDCFYENRVNV